MNIFKKNEFWLLIFSIGLLYWLFNPSVLMTLVMIVPLLLATTAKKQFYKLTIYLLSMTKSIKFKLNLTNDTIFDSSKLNNKTVLFFYPKAMTGGCSIEVQDFQKKLATFKKLGFDVFGASKDTVEKNTKFSDKYKLKYELGSDLTDACEKLGIWIEKSMYGKKYFGINRSTFILDKKGKILHSWSKVKVKDHVEEVILFIKENKF